MDKLSLYDTIAQDSSDDSSSSSDENNSPPNEQITNKVTPVVEDKFNVLPDNLIDEQMENQTVSITAVEQEQELEGSPEIDMQQTQSMVSESPAPIDEAFEMARVMAPFQDQRINEDSGSYQEPEEADAQNEVIMPTHDINEAVKEETQEPKVSQFIEETEMVVSETVANLASDVEVNSNTLSANEEDESMQVLNQDVINSGSATVEELHQVTLPAQEPVSGIMETITKEQEPVVYEQEIMQATIAEQIFENEDVDLTQTEQPEEATVTTSQVAFKADCSEDSELDQKFLREQESDQDFSDNEAGEAKKENDRAFEEGSEDDDINMITVTNPILFTEHLAVMGRVPLMFFLPDVEESIKLRALIEAHGGRCIDQQECGAFQIRPQSKTTLDFNNFYAGTLYDEQWIKDSIAVGSQQMKDEYVLGINDSDDALKLNIGKRKKITIVEGMKLYKIFGAQKFDKVGNETYKGIERQGYLPERSIDTMKNFWKEYSQKTLEMYLLEAIFYKWDYCLSFKEIPNEEFETKHRQHFAYEYHQLEAADYHNAYERQQDVGNMVGGMTSYAGLDEISSDSDDIFNDRVTDKLDEMNKQEAMKFSVLDNMGTPDKFMAQQLEQETGATKMHSSAKTDLLMSAGNDQKSSIIDTNGPQAAAFDTGMSGEKRIDLSSLIDNGMQAAVSKQNLPQLKAINRLQVAAIIGQKRTYSQASSLCYTASTRPCKTLEQASEQMKQKRFKRYTPQEREYPAYEPWEFQKQMDLEFMEIKVNSATYKQQGNHIIPKLYRTVVRKPNDEGKFKWLEIELHEMASQFSRPFDEIITIFEQVNCDKKKLRQRLEGDSFCSWKKIEDLTLKNYYDAITKNGGQAPSGENPAYTCLLEEKGHDEIAARNKFLGFVLA